MVSSFPRIRRAHDSFRLSQLANWVSGRVVEPDDDPQLDRVAPLAEAGPRALGLLAARSYLTELGGSDAGAILVSEELAAELPDGAPPAVVVDDAHQALAVLLDRLHPEDRGTAARHPSSVISSTARLADDVHVGPFAVIEDHAVIEEGVRIGAHAVVGEGVTVGEDSWIFPHVVLYPGSRIGRRVRIHSGARIGVDGFGYVLHEGRHRKVPQVGRCVIGDDVEIGANTTVDRGSIGDTRIETGAKIDNLVQLGHNTRIGEHSIVVAQAGIAGSTRVGAGVLIGGQVGIAGHVSIGDGARLSAQAGVTGNVPAGQTVMGFPARPRMEFLRSVAAQKSSRELLQRIRAVERRLDSAADPSTASSDAEPVG